MVVDEQCAEQDQRGPPFEGDEFVIVTLLCILVVEPTVPGQRREGRTLVAEQASLALPPQRPNADQRHHNQQQ